MKQLFLFIGVLLATFALKAQQEYIVNEQFDNNDRNWPAVNDKKSKSQVYKGKYYMQCGSSYASYRFWTSLPVNTDENFEIEGKFVKLAGDKTKFNGLVWGAYGWDNSYNFQISESKYFRIWGYKEGNAFFMKKDTYSSKINDRGNNILTVKKSGNYLQFYINGSLVHSESFKKFFGKYGGFVVDTDCSIAADYFTLKQKGRQIVTVSKSISKYNKENMGIDINSPYSEIAPVIAPDGKTLYIARQGHPKNNKAGKYDIWYSELQADGNWGRLKHAPAPLNNYGDNVVIAVSPDNNALMLENLYKRDGSFKTDQGISVSFRTSTGWSVPRELKVRDYQNLDIHESFCPTANRKVLIMSVEREGGYGRKDLWVSFLQGDGSYSKPKNMGPVLNSYDDEGTPYIAPDNKTLYFYSFTEPGYGSADIFVSKRLDDSWTNWSKPKNLGTKINSSDWDVYYTVDAKGEYAYLVSSKNSYGNEDIFRIKLRDEEKPDPVVLVSGRVLDKKTGKPIGTNIIYENTKTGKTEGIARSNPANGSYKVILPYGIEYEIRAVKANYFALSEVFDLRNIDEYQEIERNLLLSPIEKEETILLQNVNFYSTQARLLPESYPELKRLAELMKKNPNMVIELHGHTESTPGYEEQLTALSERRIKAVKAYLTNKGISEDRIKEKAFGGSKPIADNNTKEGRKQNRRVEFKILSK